VLAGIKIYQRGFGRYCSRQPVMATESIAHALTCATFGWSEAVSWGLCLCKTGTKSIPMWVGLSMQTALTFCRARCPLPDGVAKGYWSTVRFWWLKFEIEVFENRLEVYHFYDRATDIWYEDHAPGHGFSTQFVRERVLPCLVKARPQGVPSSNPGGPTKFLTRDHTLPGIHFGNSVRGSASCRPSHRGWRATKSSASHARRFYDSFTSYRRHPDTRADNLKGSL